MRIINSPFCCGMTLMALFIGQHELVAGDEVVLSPRNTEVPFSYVVGGSRSWPVFSGTPGDNDVVKLTATIDDKTMATGDRLRFSGFRVSLAKDGFLTVESSSGSDQEFHLDLMVHRAGKSLEQQTIIVRPAPPNRPLSYVSDLVDDLIRIYWDSSARQFRPVTKDAFDQYFRRLQAQGITRLIVWQSSFPLIVDPANYQPEDWRRFEGQAKAILECEALKKGMQKFSSPRGYQWLSFMMQLRLNNDFDRLYTQSALDHGIKLSVSFRPFEAALTKYYEVATFDEDGTWLWGFLPGASPVVNYRSRDVSFAHYREILRRMGKQDEADLTAIEIGGLADPQGLADRLNAGHEDIRIMGAPFAPLDESTLVLKRDSSGEFSLVPYHTIQAKTLSHQIHLDKATYRVDAGQLIIEDITVPEACRYLILKAGTDEGTTVEFPVVPDVTLRAKAGNKLGRANVYCALNGDTPAARLTRVAGIPVDGGYRTEFQAIEKSIDHFRKTKQKTWSLSEGSLVIDRGESFSVEMTDFNRPAARDFVVRELQTILAHDAFDEIFINTRSHTQLSSSTGDGIDGIQPMAYYRLNGVNYFHYGIERGFGPVALSENEVLKTQPVEQVTTFQKGEWKGEPCQSADTEFQWRYQRNKEVARGVRSLLTDLENEFPNTRIRAVIPQNEAVVRGTEADLDNMKKTDGSVYGRKYLRNIHGSLNHMPSFGEGMAMLDLSGLDVEPVFLGIRFAPDDAPLNAFVDRCIGSLANNLGSKFQGPKSFFYEAQETLRGKNTVNLRERREQIILNLLRRDAIGEVLLYEAADWTYYLPLSDRDISGHTYLDGLD